MEWIEITLMIIKAIFAQKPTPEIVLISIGTLALLVGLNIGLVKLWNKRKKKSATTLVKKGEEENEKAT